MGLYQYLTPETNSSGEIVSLMKLYSALSLKTLPETIFCHLVDQESQAIYFPLFSNSYLSIQIKLDPQVLQTHTRYFTQVFLLSRPKKIFDITKLSSYGKRFSHIYISKLAQYFAKLLFTPLFLLENISSVFNSVYQLRRRAS